MALCNRIRDNYETLSVNVETQPIMNPVLALLVLLSVQILSFYSSLCHLLLDILFPSFSTQYPACCQTAMFRSCPAQPAVDFTSTPPNPPQTSPAYRIFFPPLL